MKSLKKMLRILIISVKKCNFFSLRSDFKLAQLLGNLDRKYFFYSNPLMDVLDATYCSDGTVGDVFCLVDPAVCFIISIISSSFAVSKFNR